MHHQPPSRKGETTEDERQGQGNSTFKYEYKKTKQVSLPSNERWTVAVGSEINLR